jgi:hypothetical protein
MRPGCFEYIRPLTSCSICAVPKAMYVPFAFFHQFIDFDDFLQFALVSQPARDTITILVEKAAGVNPKIVNSLYFSLKMRRWVSSLSKSIQIGCEPGA